MENIRQEIIRVIRLAQTERRWRPGSAARHLLKRKVRGHLPIDATLVDYDRVIQDVLWDTVAQVYAYWYEDTPYVAVVSILGDNHWLVMVDFDGWMESAYTVSRPERYFNKSEFEFIGILGELL